MDPLLRAAAGSVKQGNCYQGRASAFALVEKSEWRQDGRYVETLLEDQTGGKNSLFPCTFVVNGSANFGGEKV